MSAQTSPALASAKPTVSARPARRRRGGEQPRWLWVWLGIVYLYIFVPIIVVVVYSFNSRSSVAVFGQPSLRWYSTLFHDTSIRSSLYFSIEIAAIVTVLSTVIGVGAALGLDRGSPLLARPTEAMVLLRIMSPEITGAIAFLLLFTEIGLPLGGLTMTVAHVCFCVVYVTVIVRSRLRTLDPAVEEAAEDLGATHLASLRLVVLPQLRPAILASAVLVFLLSFDDFATSYFTIGAGTQPLPVRIYSMIRFGVSPEINALGTLITLVTVVVGAAATFGYARVQSRQRQALKDRLG
ncbi:MAG: ABC transporter permease [Streptosporangiaceae bacterium]